jgi:hypothetical protein
VVVGAGVDVGAAVAVWIDSVGGGAVRLVGVGAVVDTLSALSVGAVSVDAILVGLSSPGVVVSRRVGLAATLWAV